MKRTIYIYSCDCCLKDVKKDELRTVSIPVKINTKLTENVYSVFDVRDADLCPECTEMFANLYDNIRSVAIRKLKEEGNNERSPRGVSK